MHFAWIVPSGSGRWPGDARVPSSDRPSPRRRNDFTRAGSGRSRVRPGSAVTPGRTPVRAPRRRARGRPPGAARRPSTTPTGPTPRTTSGTAPPCGGDLGRPPGHVRRRSPCRPAASRRPTRNDGWPVISTTRRLRAIHESLSGALPGQRSVEQLLAAAVDVDRDRQGAFLAELDECAAERPRVVVVEVVQHEVMQLGLEVGDEGGGIGHGALLARVSVPAKPGRSRASRLAVDGSRIADNGHYVIPRWRALAPAECARGRRGLRQAAERDPGVRTRTSPVARGRRARDAGSAAPRNG